MAKEQEWLCCFCGKIILRTRFDPGALAYTPAAEHADEPVTQGLYCHAKCLESRLHSSIKLYALDIATDE